MSPVFREKAEMLVFYWFKPCLLLRYCVISPLFAAAVNSGRFLQRGLEDGFENGHIFLEDDGRHSKIPLQFLCALTEILRQVGHVLPLLQFVEELNKAEEQNSYFKNTSASFCLKCMKHSPRETSLVSINNS